MKRTVYTLTLLVFLVVLTSAINSFKNRTLVLPPSDKVLDLPEVVDDYQVTIPPNVIEMLMGWGEADTTIINDITNDGATLGRALFYDDRLSGDNTLSCGSCHKQELSFADDVAFSKGIGDNITTRNSMTLNDLGWQLPTHFFWDFRSASLSDAVRQPILADHELGKDIPTLIEKLKVADEYAPLFEAAYGDPEITEEGVTNALSMFITSMSSFDSKYDKNFNGDENTFTESEIRGLNLFESNCSFCHITPHFGSADPLMFFIPGNNGLDSVITDSGMGEWMGDEIFNGTFKSPSLRNIEVSAPYMHDGRFETLEDVIDFYSEGVQFNENSAFNWIFGETFTGYEFDATQKKDLINFLKTLTDQTLLTDPKWSDPWRSVTNDHEYDPIDHLKVYPNPIEDKVMVEIDNPDANEYQITIYDISGKLINTFMTTDNLLEVPRAGAPSGIYELVASDGKHQKTFKLIYR